MFQNPDFQPRPVNWGGQSFTDPQALARWLIARGASPAIWALRHPGAAAGLGMPMPQGAPAAQGAQAYPSSFQGAPPGQPMSLLHAEGAPPEVGAQPDLLAAVLSGLAERGPGGPGFAGGMAPPLDPMQPPDVFGPMQEQGFDLERAKAGLARSRRGRNKRRGARLRKITDSGNNGMGKPGKPPRFLEHGSPF